MKVVFKEIAKDGLPEPNRYKEYFVTNGERMDVLAYDGGENNMSLMTDIFLGRVAKWEQKIWWLRIGAGRHGMDLLVDGSWITHYGEVEKEG